MGLLDQVLGQVIGGMAGGGGRQPAPTPSGGGLGDLLGSVLRGGGQASPAPSGGGGIGDILGQVLRGGQGGGAAAPTGGGGGLGGGLGGALGGMLSGAGGKYSPLVLALLALLANKHLSSGAGGFGSVLHDMFAGGRSRGPEGAFEDGEPDPRGGGFGGLPADEEAPGGFGGFGRRADRGGGGGFLDDVGSMLDGPGGSPQGGSARGGLGGLLGEGLEGLQQRFDQNGRGDLMQSWVGQGPNEQASPGELEQALGPGTIDQLARGTGLNRDELLQQLTRALPQVVNGLTPHGRMPSADEQRGWI